jgi:hypothetical protein
MAEHVIKTKADRIEIAWRSEDKPDKLKVTIHTDNFVDRRNAEYIARYINERMMLGPPHLPVE